MKKMIKPLCMVLGVCLCMSIHTVYKYSNIGNISDTTLSVMNFNTDGQMFLEDPGVRPPQQIS